MADEIALQMAGWQGLQTRDAGVRVPPSQLREATNVIFGNQGQAIRRPGYTAYSDAGPGEGRILLLFRTVDADKNILVYVEHSSGDVYALGIGSGQTELVLQTDTASNDVSFGSSSVRKFYPKAWAVLGDRLFMADFDSAYMWDGLDWTAGNDSWKKITDNTLNGGGTSGSPEFPFCRTMTVWGDRMVAGNCKVSGSTKHYSRLYFSNVLAPWTWDAADYIDINPDDGQQIQKIVTFGKQIVIFKDNAVYMLVGDSSGDPGDMSLYKLHNLIGCGWATMSVAQSENRLFWFDPDQGVFSFDGARIERIDKDLADMLPTAAVNHHQVAYGWVHKDRYYLSLDLEDVDPEVEDKEPDTTFVYDIRSGGWSKWTVGWRCAAQYEDTIYAVGLTDGFEGIATILGSALTDGADDFTWTIKTAWVPPIEEQGFEPWRVHRVRAWMRGTEPTGTETGNATITLFKDYDDSVDWRVVTFDTERSSDEVMAIADYSAPAGSLVSALAFEVSSDQQVHMELYGLAALFSRRERQKGVNA